MSKNKNVSKLFFDIISTDLEKY